ncbi:MAG: helix-turn-helix transcriptional regulator [Flavobacteriaceae bacterium]|nr:helix-turn-helix transcriptional regulator [Flavobacteriaceae bacterium]
MIKLDELLNRIRLVMESHGLSYTEFANKIGVQRSVLSHVFSKRNRPSLDFLLRIHDSFDSVTLDWLVLGIGKFESLNNSLNDEPENPYPIAQVGMVSNNNESNQKINSDTKTNKPSEKSDFQQLSEEQQPHLSPISTPKEIVYFFDDGSFKIFRERNK